MEISFDEGVNAMVYGLRGRIRDVYEQIRKTRAELERNDPKPATKLRKLDELEKKLDNIAQLTKKLESEAEELIKEAKKLEESYKKFAIGVRAAEEALLQIRRELTHLQKEGKRNKVASEPQPSKARARSTSNRSVSESNEATAEGYKSTRKPKIRPSPAKPIFHVEPIWPINNRIGLAGSGGAWRSRRSGTVRNVKRRRGLKA